MVLLPFYLTGAAAAAAVLLAPGTRGTPAMLWALPAFVGGFLAGVVLALLLCAVLSLFADPKKTAQEQDPFWFPVAGYAMGVICALAGIRLRAVGLEQIPAGRWLLVSNHRSAFDPLATGRLLRREHLAFISKLSNFRIPVARRVIPSLCYLGLDREDNRAALKVILQAAELIRSGAVSYCVYPEGTRNRGEELLPFRNGVFKIAQRAKCPIVIARIDGTDRVRRNFPWHPTFVTLTVCGVLDAETVQQLKTNEIGEQVRKCIDSASC